MEQSGFFWIRLTSPQGHAFEPLIAWRHQTGWRIPGSNEEVPEGTIIDVLEGPIKAPSLTKRAT